MLVQILHQGRNLITYDVVPMSTGYISFSNLGYTTKRSSMMGGPPSTTLNKRNGGLVFNLCDLTNDLSPMSLVWIIRCQHQRKTILGPSLEWRWLHIDVKSSLRMTST